MYIPTCIHTYIHEYILLLCSSCHDFGWVLFTFQSVGLKHTGSGASNVSEMKEGKNKQKILSSSSNQSRSILGALDNFFNFFPFTLIFFFSLEPLLAPSTATVVGTTRAFHKLRWVLGVLGSSLKPL